MRLRRERHGAQLEPIGPPRESTGSGWAQKQGSPMPFYAYGTAQGTSWRPTGAHWIPMGTNRIRMGADARQTNAFLCIWDCTGNVMASHWSPLDPHGNQSDLDGPRSKETQCLSMHTGLHRKACRVRVGAQGIPLCVFYAFYKVSRAHVSAQGTALEPHGTPLDPDVPTSNGSTCYSILHRGYNTKIYSCEAI